MQTNGHLSSTVAAATRNNRSRSRSPALRKPLTAQPAESNQVSMHILLSESFNLTLVSKNKEKAQLSAIPSPAVSRRSMSPSPRRLSDMRKKQSSLESATTHVTSVQIPLESSPEPTLSESKVEASVNAPSNDGANKYENVSDNGSEISDEGYRSLGLIQSNNAKRISVHSQASNEDAETNGKKFYFKIINKKLNFLSSRASREKLKFT